MKIALFYYSQTGQSAIVAKNLFAGYDSATTIIYKRIHPLHNYHYPWRRDDFFDVFPETRLCVPPSGIYPIDFSDVNDAQLVVIVGQSWFLSPSLPLQSFFANEQTKEFLHERKVIFVNACRNMWLETSRWLKNYFQKINARWIGHIVLQDHAPNLISAITIVRWLIRGKKDATLLLPSAGISEKDLTGIHCFGEIILDVIRHQDFDHLQERLLEHDAIDYKPSILFIEHIGYRFFGAWAKLIRKKGGMGDPRRRCRVTLFYYYLIFALFFVSPFAQLIFYLTYPLHKVKKHKYIDCCLLQS